MDREEVSVEKKDESVESEKDEKQTSYDAEEEESPNTEHTPLFSKEFVDNFWCVVVIVLIFLFIIYTKYGGG